MRDFILAIGQYWRDLMSQRLTGWRAGESGQDVEPVLLRRERLSWILRDEVPFLYPGLAGTTPPMSKPMYIQQVRSSAEQTRPGVPIDVQPHDTSPKPGRARVEQSRADKSQGR